MIQDSVLGWRDSLAMRPLMKRMAKGWRELSFESVELADYDWVDRQALGYYERAFASLGFRTLDDLSSGQSGNVEGFMRLMGHEAERVTVSLMVTKILLRSPQPFACALNSPLSQGWVMGATDGEANPILTQLRLPRAVALRDCDAAPAELWRQTLLVREQLMQEKSLQPVGEASVSGFVAMSQCLNRERAELVAQITPVQFAVRRRVLMRTPPPRRALWTGEWTPQTPPLDGLVTEGLSV